MKIIELYIENFGGVSDKHLSFSDGINLIVGDNETGKSTAVAFISYVFFGFSDRKEKKLLSDVRSGTSCGSIEIETDDGKRYRVTRRETQSGKPTVEVFDENGESFDEWKSFPSLGEYFFGIPHTLFSRSLLVDQREGLLLADGSVDALRNLMLSGSETQELQKALKKLDDRRVELLHKKGKGGRIDELDREIDDYSRCFREGAELRERAEISGAEITASELELGALKVKYAKVSSEISARREAAIRELLIEKDGLEKQYKESEAASLALELAYKERNFLPDSGYVDELKKASQNAALKAKESELKYSKLNVTEASGFSYIRENGGPEAVGKKVGELKGSAHKHRVICAVSVIFSIIVLFISGLMFRDTPIFTALFAVSWGALVVGLIFLALFVRDRRGLGRIFTALSVKSADEVAVVCEQYRVRANGTAAAEKEYLTAKADSERADEYLRELLRRWGRSSVDEALEMAERYLSASEEFNEKKNEAARKLELNRTKLKFYDTAEIELAEKNMASGAELPNLDSEASLAEPEAEHDRLNAMIRDGEKRLSQQKIEHASRYSNLPSLAEIKEKSELLCEQRTRLKYVYDAAILAYDTLKNADDELRKSVAPYLSDVSGEVFSELTGGRYGGLGVSSDDALRLSFLSDGSYMDSVFLSAGSSALAWFSLRLAIYGRITEKTPLPLILDECFVYLDDKRLERVLKKLLSLAEKGSQVLLFSANHREENVFGRLGANVNVVTLGSDDETTL